MFDYTLSAPVCLAVAYASNYKRCYKYQSAKYEKKVKNLLKKVRKLVDLHASQNALCMVPIRISPSEL